MSTLLQDFRRELLVYRTDEIPRVIYASKSALAVIVSMLVCMLLELRSPGTSMVSAVIVMINQQSGMTIARAFYRTIGICCGSIAGFLLISQFAQAPPLFLAGLAIWVGFSVAGSSYYKNYQSYGFVLSGYAACITTVPEWATPYDVTTNIIYTVSEVVIGVATGSLISALVLPQKVVPALVKWRASAVIALLGAYRSAALGNTADDTVDAYIKLVRESASMEDLRTAAVFEDPEMRLRNDALIEVERTFLDAITRVHAIHRARQAALAGDPDEQARACIDGLFSALAQAAEPIDEARLHTKAGLDELHARLRVLDEALPVQVEQGIATEPPGATGRTAIEMAGAEVYSASSSLLEFCGACRVLLDPPKIRFSLSVVQAIAFMRRVPIRSSPVTALVSGLRAATAMAVVGAAWIASGWTNGAIAVVAAGITSGFYSLSPTPVKGSWQAFVGCLFAAVTGFFVNFVVMPVAGDIAWFALCLAVVIFIGSYVNSFPQHAGLGAIFNVYFCYVLTPANVAVYDPPYLLDRSFGLLFGIAVAASAFSLVLPREGEWRIRKYSARISGLLVDAARGDIDADLAVETGRAIRDLIVRIMTVPDVSAEEHERTAKWAFGQFWMASALLEVRKLGDAGGRALPEAWSGAQRDWLSAMAAVTASNDEHTAAEAIAATERALQVLRVPAAHETPDAWRVLFPLRAQLYSTRAALTGQSALPPDARPVQS
ncbi:FUSC family protein [Caballeronia sp. LZ035]|uniref:FUSC family protein n=1 Tax=Caballeronia sp. LZ035 TaxID=3038568 RepID=UPI00286748D8|nr:FUSC family protein [Caballeronia sp. LZ035]MDR5760849.1 FUSC family protein [Caballeronia sp. LZ035]